MTKIIQRYSKRQTTGTTVHEGAHTECEHWLHAEIRRTTRSFLDRNERNRRVAAAECFNVPQHEVTDKMMTSPEVFNYMYENFSQYYVIIDEPTYSYTAN